MHESSEERDCDLQRSPSLFGFMNPSAEPSLTISSARGAAGLGANIQAMEHMLKWLNRPMWSSVGFDASNQAFVQKLNHNSKSSKL